MKLYNTELYSTLIEPTKINLIGPLFVIAKTEDPSSYELGRKKKSEFQWFKRLFNPNEFSLIIKIVKVSTLCQFIRNSRRPTDSHK